MPKVKMVCGDTMNYWIADHTENLQKVLRELDVLLINDGEARMLCGRDEPRCKAAEKVLAMGPKILVVKHGEYGATAFFGDRSFRWRRSDDAPFRAPALPLAEVVDPTGAGDSFAGGFYGYLASQPELTPAVFRTAMFYGGVMGSFAVERFGTERLQAVTREEIDERFELFREISHLGDAAGLGRPRWRSTAATGGCAWSWTACVAGCGAAGQPARRHARLRLARWCWRSSR